MRHRGCLQHLCSTVLCKTDKSSSLSLCWKLPIHSHDRLFCCSINDLTDQRNGFLMVSSIHTGCLCVLSCIVTQTFHLFRLCIPFCCVERGFSFYKVAECSVSLEQTADVPGYGNPFRSAFIPANPISRSSESYRAQRHPTRKLSLFTSRYKETVSREGRGGARGGKEEAADPQQKKSFAPLFIAPQILSQYFWY